MHPNYKLGNMIGDDMLLILCNSTSPKNKQYITRIMMHKNTKQTKQNNAYMHVLPVGADFH